MRDAMRFVVPIVIGVAMVITGIVLEEPDQRVIGLSWLW